MDLGVALQEIVDQEPVGGVADRVVEQELALERIGAGIPVPLVDQDVQPFEIILWAEIGQARGSPAAGKDRIDAEVGRIGFDRGDVAFHLR